MSEGYARVRRYYMEGLWTQAMLKSAVGRWITQEEYRDILLQKGTEGIGTIAVRNEGEGTIQ